MNIINVTPKSGGVHDAMDERLDSPDNIKSCATAIQNWYLKTKTTKFAHKGYTYKVTVYEFKPTATFSPGYKVGILTMKVCI